MSSPKELENKTATIVCLAGNYGDHHGDGGGTISTTTTTTTTTVKLPPPLILDVFRSICTLAIRPMAFVCRIWTGYFPGRVGAAEGVLRPGSVLGFIIGGLFSFVEIKSQAQSGFPFQTHSNTVKISISSLLMYGFACGVEQVVSASQVGRNSGYVVIARWAEFLFVYMLLGSLAFMLYFDG